MRAALIFWTAAAIVEEVKDTTVFVLPGGVHETSLGRLRI
jgi:hypothetical protein